MAWHSRLPARDAKGTDRHSDWKIAIKVSVDDGLLHREINYESFFIIYINKLGIIRRHIPSQLLNMRRLYTVAAMVIGM
uniref:Uncharacterized protein n=1 Tax=Physcomitrium patens TaxID=3218 RepID=A0A2K1IXI7_PHYPA|nr:hypothetical protein PHYPA_023804 [Physcomitrium patens]